MTLILYKYVSDYRATEFLLQGICKFTPIRELNDPSELSPNFVATDVAESRDRLRQRGYSDEELRGLLHQQCLFQRLTPHRQAVSVPSTKEMATSLIRSPFYDDLATLERLLEDTAGEMASKVGLFCLSRRFDSLPMWAHYASNAAGLVVEFSGLEGHFTGDDTAVLNQPVPVQYDRDRRGVTFDPRSHESIFFAKYPDWSYEQEVRVVLPLEECDAQTHSSGARLFSHRVPKRLISRVILGWNMPSEHLRFVQEQARRLNGSVSIVRSRIRRGQVELEAER